MTKQIETHTLREWLDAQQPATVLDIRTDDDRIQWAIPGSLHVNAYEALRNGQPGALADLVIPADRPVVTICSAGRVSQIAAEVLANRGFDAAWRASDRARDETGARAPRAGRPVRSLDVVKTESHGARKGRQVLILTGQGGTQMRSAVRCVVSLMALLSPITTVTATAQGRTGVMSDLIAAVALVESKIVGLAKAMPESAYAWRPADGVRSAGEVFIHLAGENYYAAAKFGNMTQAGTGVTGAVHTEADAYEQRKMTRPQVIDGVEQSFALMRRAMLATPDDRLETMTEYSRQKVTLRTAWVRTTVHMHEHLGQLIAYARSNKIVPPWSK